MPPRPGRTSLTTTDDAERANRRLSRVTPSEFENMLKGNETVVFVPGRDESLLGRTATSPLDEGTGLDTPDGTPVASASQRRASARAGSSSPFSTPSKPPLSASSGSGRRSSAQKGVEFEGVQWKPRETNGRSSNGAGAAAEKGKGVDAGRRGSAAADPPRTPEKADSARTSSDTLKRTPIAAAHAVLRRTPPSPAGPAPPQLNLTTPTRGRVVPINPFSTPPSRSGGIAPSPTATHSQGLPLPTSPARLSSHGTLNSVSSVGSFVHVSSPREEREEEPIASTSRAPTFGMQPAVGVGSQLDLGGGTRKYRAGSAKGDDESQKSSSFSSTMRKTSRFFRKLGGSASSKSSSQSGYTSTPPTPTNHFAFSSAQELPPPVPPVPTAYASTSPTKPSPNHSPTNSAELFHRRGQTVPLPPPDRAHLRRRSVSLNSVGTAALLQRQSDVGKGTEEAERLRSELKAWKLDIDGVLGAIGDGSGLTLSPNLARVSSGPASPTIRMPTFEPLGMSFSRSRPNSPRTQTEPTFPSTSLEARSTSDASVIGRPNSTTPTSTATLMPPTLRSASAPLPSPPASISARTPAAILPEQEPPSIRLVSPSSTYSELPDDAHPHEFLAPTPNAVAEGSVPALETISEATHSRESSLATPGTTPQGPPGPPLLFTQSPSPTPASPSPLPNAPPLQVTPSGGTRRALRQSVVAYPFGRSPVLPQSHSSSTTSLHSERSARRDNSGRSTEAGSGGEDGKTESSAVGAPLDDRASSFAQRCWEEDESFLEARKIAEWLGSLGRLNVAALKTYINFFDFTGLRLDLAFRRLCDKLYLKAETQQVDRILEQFSRRYWEHNPKSVYGGPDVVHAVAYSLLLLNTDLHVVDSSTRMSRQQFVRNTISAIHAQTGEPEVLAPGLLFGERTPEEGDPTNVFGGDDHSLSPRKSIERLRDHLRDHHMSGSSKARRSGSIRSWKDAATTNAATASMPDLTVSPARGLRSTTSIDNSPGGDRIRSHSITAFSPNAPVTVSDAELESTLKEMYNAIKVQPIFQPMNSPSAQETQSSLSLTPASSPYGSWNGLNRTGSRRSGTSSMSGSSTGFKRSSVRGFGSYLGTSSLDLVRSSSPTPSTSTSFSEDNPNTAYGLVNSHHLTPTIGFANSLSHSIIREQKEDDASSDDRVSLTDEDLALLGAPWAKEGLLQRKHYWESQGKRAKEKGWLQAFVVISQGEVRMFRFDGAGTTRGGTGLGGGDWTSTAQSVGEVSLIHALCSPVPPPGYSRDRPHCFILTLPGGGSYFFQAGTQDLVAEWVATCNYWSARLSKEPLSGGVSNMEYGWNRVASGEDDREEIASIRSGRSGKSGYSRSGSVAASTHGNALDRITISEWKAPNVPHGASILSEEAQLDSLRRHIAIVRGELAQHNALQSQMTRLFSPRSINLTKATANWKRRSDYLSSEILKYQTYIETLANSIKLRALKSGQKEVDEMLRAADAIDRDQSDTSPVPDVDVDVDDATLHDDELEIRDVDATDASHGEEVGLDNRLSTVSVAETEEDEFFEVNAGSPALEGTFPLSV